MPSSHLGLSKIGYITYKYLTDQIEHASIRYLEIAVINPPQKKNDFYLSKELIISSS